MTRTKAISMIVERTVTEVRGIPAAVANASGLAWLGLLIPLPLLALRTMRAQWARLIDLGAAVAIAVAQEHPPASLVLRSPFTSLPDVASVHYPYLPTGLLLRNRYPSIETITTLDIPVLVIAGSHDTIVPVAQSREVFDAAPRPKRFVTIEGADHNDPALSHGPELIDEVTSFIDGATQSR